MYKICFSQNRNTVPEAAASQAQAKANQNKTAKPVFYRHKSLRNNSSTTHYDSLQGLYMYWADQKDSHNEVIITSLQGQ